MCIIVPVYFSVPQVQQKMQTSDNEIPLTPLARVSLFFAHFYEINLYCNVVYK
jgi:hypothetical protein